MTASEVQWIAAQISLAAQLTAVLTGGPEEDLPSLIAMDHALVGWREHSRDQFDATTMVNAFGTTFGEHLRLSTGLVWVIAEDGAGTDLALHGQPGDILMYPASSVAKRVMSEDPRLLEQMHAALSDRVRHVMAAADPLG